jgi:signal peptidase I
MDDQQQETQEPELEQEEEKLSPRQRKTVFVGVLIGIFDFVKTVVTIVVLAVAIRVFVIQPYIVEGQSMEQTFQNNDYLITEKISFRYREPQRGEVVIFHPPDNPSVNYIKRIVGLPEDKVEVKDGSVYINSNKVYEPYLKSNEETLNPKEKDFAYTLKENEYFVFGDNRNHSRDSREIGAIPKENIVSRVWFRLLPINNLKAFAAVEYNI